MLLSIYLLEDLADDATALKRHHEALRKELQKHVPDRSVVQALMRKTFPLRRSKCKDIHASKRVKEMMSLYPCLKWIDQVTLCEFDVMFKRRCL